MGRIEWKYTYRFQSGSYRYYGRANPRGEDIPLRAFVVDHLNTTRRQLILGMSNIRRKEEATIRRLSRVDTGNMRSLVTGTGDFGTDILKISFGWEELRPYYAPFQEFGTRTGIEPMMAVFTAYHDALAEVRTILGHRR